MKITNIEFAEMHTNEEIIEITSVPAPSDCYVIFKDDIGEMFKVIAFRIETFLRKPPHIAGHHIHEATDNLYTWITPIVAHYPSEPMITCNCSEDIIFIGTKCECEEENYRLVEETPPNDVHGIRCPHCSLLTTHNFENPVTCQHCNREFGLTINVKDPEKKEFYRRQASRHPDSIKILSD